MAVMESDSLNPLLLLAKREQNKLKLYVQKFNWWYRNLLIDTNIISMNIFLIWAYGGKLERFMA